MLKFCTCSSSFFTSLCSRFFNQVGWSSSRSAEREEHVQGNWELPHVFQGGLLCCFAVFVPSQVEVARRTHINRGTDTVVLHQVNACLLALVSTLSLFTFFIYIFHSYSRENNDFLFWCHNGKCASFVPYFYYILGTFNPPDKQKSILKAKQFICRWCISVYFRMINGGWNVVVYRQFNFTYWSVLFPL